MTTVFPPGAGPQAFAFPGAVPFPAPPPRPQATADAAAYEIPTRPETGSAVADAAEGSAEAQASPEEARRSVEEVNKVLEGLGYRLSFGFYEATGEFYAQLVDRRTNEVIKMIPSEDVLKFHAKFQEALGLIIDETV